jgi:hypothetical protein
MNRIVRQKSNSPRYEVLATGRIEDVSAGAEVGADVGAGTGAGVRALEDDPDLYPDAPVNGSRNGADTDMGAEGTCAVDW